MKRTFILSLCLCVASALFAQRHDTVVIITKAEAPVERAAVEAPAAATAVAACCDQDFNQRTYANDPEEGYYGTKWELGVKAGINYFHTDPSVRVVGASSLGWTVGVQLHYNFNDVWAIMGQLNALSFSRTNLVGYTFGLDLGARANLTNLIVPHRSELSRRFNVNASAGIGFSPLDRVYAANKESDAWGMYGNFFLMLDAEARFSRLVGVFVEAEARGYFTGANTDNNVVGAVRPMVGINGGIRFHF